MRGLLIVARRQAASLRRSGRFPTARFAVFTARSLRPRLCSSHAAGPLLFSPRCEDGHEHEVGDDYEEPCLEHGDPPNGFNLN